jgi:tetratricopeptide (TPR) repeat protein
VTRTALLARPGVRVGLVVLVAIVAASAILFAARTDRGPAQPRAKTAPEVDERFAQAVVMLHAKQYEPAVAALHRVLELAPRMPEAHVNMGFALLGMGKTAAAGDFFRSAIELRSTQANAYYGLALAVEAQGDLHAALGAMRTYLHVSKADDPYRTKARSAIWEWEQALGRHGTAAAPAPAAAPTAAAAAAAAPTARDAKR